MRARTAARAGGGDADAMTRARFAQRALRENGAPAARALGARAGRASAKFKEGRGSAARRQPPAQE
jgi:hypothetical protein